MKKIENKIKKAIETFSESELMELNNIYCECYNCPDSIIYFNDEEFYEMAFSTAYDAVGRIGANFNSNHDYVFFDGYGNLETSNYLTTDNLPDLLNNIIDCILNYPNEFSHLFDFELE